MLVLFLFIIHGVNDVPTQFATHDALVDLLFDEEFPDPQQYKKNFFDIMTQEETWEWLQGPFLAGTWPTETYAEAEMSPVLKHYMLSTFRRVGPVQFRMARVSNSSCETRRLADVTVERANPFDGGKVEPMGRFDTLDGTCWAEFTVKDQDTATQRRTNLVYEWTELNQPLSGLFGFGVGWYGTGGYVNYLGPSHENASATLTAMFEDEWFDRGTRVIALDWTVYNTESRLATSIHVVVEHDEAAHIIPWFRVQSFLVAPYEGASSVLRAIAEVCFLLLWARQLYLIFREIWAEGLAVYLFNYSHVFDVVLVIMQLLYAVTWALYLTNPAVANFDVEAAEFRSYFDVAELFTQTATFAGVVGLMMTLRLFVFLGLSKRMLTVWMTIQRALPDMLAFFVGALVLITGFAIMSFFIFGFVIRDFHNFIGAMSSLLRMALGDFDFELLAQSRPQLAPVFFAVFVCVVYLLALTVFIGILTRYFEATHEELKIVDRWKETTPSFEGEIRTRCIASRTIASLRCRHCFWARVDASDLRPAAPAPPPTSLRGEPTTGPVSAQGGMPAPPHGMAGFEQAVRAEIAAAQNQLELLRLQTAFFRAATKCAVLAKFNNGIDLQNYFEHTYELEPNSDRLFVTRDALAVIIGRRMASRGPGSVTVHGVHIRRQDFAAAEAFVRAFRLIKSTEVFGAALEMETPELRAVSLVRPFSAGGEAMSRLVWLRERLQGASLLGPDSDSPTPDGEAGNPAPSLSNAGALVLGRRSARVVQVDSMGAEVDRVLAIDNGHLGLWAAFCADSKRQAGSDQTLDASGEVVLVGHKQPTPPPLAAAACTQDAQLLILDLQARPIRSVPLHLLILTEEYRDDPRYAELVFGSKQTPITEEKTRGILNMNVRVRFESASSRATFMKELLQCAGAAAATLEDDVEDDEGDEDDGLTAEDTEAVPVSDGAEAIAAKGSAGVAAEARASVSSVPPRQKRKSAMTSALLAMSRRLGAGRASAAVPPLQEGITGIEDISDSASDADGDDDDDDALSDSAMAAAAAAAKQESPRSGRIKHNPLLLLRERK